MKPLDQRLVDAFFEAAIFLKHHVEHDNWKWTSNFLREYARARSRMTFSNNLSPVVMDEVIKQHPELGAWIKLNVHKPRGYNYVFDIVKRLVPTGPKH